MDPRSGAARNPRRLVLSAAYLAAIILAWGSNYVLMKLALPNIVPMGFACVRVAGTAIIVAAFVFLRKGEFLPIASERMPLAAIGLLQVACTLGFGILGLDYISAGRAAVLMYTMPLWAMPLEYWLLRQTVSIRQVLGAVISLAGLALYFDPALVDWHDARAVAGNGYLLLAAMSWALGASIYRRRSWHTGFWTQTSWQMFVSVPPLVLGATMTWDRPAVWSIGLLSILLFNWLIATALAYWCWAKLLTELTAAVAGQLLMLTPLVGYFLSSIVFGDPITAGILVSLTLMLAGLTLTVRARTV